MSENADTVVTNTPPVPAPEAQMEATAAAAVNPPTAAPVDTRITPETGVMYPATGPADVFEPPSGPGSPQVGAEPEVAPDTNAVATTEQLAAAALVPPPPAQPESLVQRAEDEASAVCKKIEVDIQWLHSVIDAWAEEHFHVSKLTHIERAEWRPLFQSYVGASIGVLKGRIGL